ncbi:MAG: ribonuclease E inhibitor RraB [Idiomarina sp.]|nr:ribonuclease E inhibitor RraB [Idiomarina sp.]
MSEPEYDVLDSEQACRAFTRETLAELKDAGAEMEEPHLVEHHLFSPNFEKLEKAVVELAKKGYEVEDADEVEMEDGSEGFCCDVMAESPLTQDALNEQTDLIISLVKKFDIEYDGWGTYLPEIDGDEDDFEDDETIVH